MEVKARDVYGKKVSFLDNGEEKFGYIFGLDKTTKSVNGVFIGVEDIYHVIVKNRVKDELFELKRESFKFID